MTGAAPGRRILWVTEEPPDRHLGGGNIRQAHLFEALSRSFAVDLLLAGRLTDERIGSVAASVTELPVPSPRMTAHPLGRRALELGISLRSPYPLPLYAARGARRELGTAIAAAAATPDLVIVEHAALAPLAAVAHRQPWVITFHHLLSQMLAEELAIAPGARQRWFRARDLGKARRLEQRALQAYARCIVCSDEDAVRLASVSGSPLGDRVPVIPNGVDLAAIPATPVPRDPKVLLPGTLSWGPNVDGAVWFCTQAWPAIRRRVPGASLVLAGRSPLPEVLELAGLPGVSVDADVPSMVPYFEAARAVVVPLRVGTGTRLKALEAMAAARPVVGTTIGLDGIGATDGVHALIADDPAAIADGVVKVLADDGTADSLGRAGRAHVEARFGWDRIGARFVDVIAELLAHGATQRQAPVRSSSSAA